MPGLIGHLRDTAGGLLTLPGNIVRGLSEGWRAYGDSFDAHALAKQQRAAAEAALLQSLGIGPPQGQPPVPVAPQAQPPQGPASFEDLRFRAPPPVAPPSIRSVANPMMRAAAAGVNVAPYLGVLTAAAPDVQVANGQAYDTRDPGNVGQRIGANLSNVNGTMVDTNDPTNANRFVPEVAEGQRPVYDERGQVIGVMDLSGYVQSLGQRESAVTGAREAASAPYRTLTFQGRDGQPVTSTIEQFTQGGGVAAGQSPAEQAASTAQVEAARALPELVDRAQGSIALIDKIIGNPALGITAHPGLETRVGLRGVLPAIPGQPGVDFDLMVKQLQGQAFLEAFQRLKGAGAITEKEGQAATDAQARLSRAQSPEGFTQALTELRGILQVGMDRANARAGQGGQPQSAPAPAGGSPTAGNFTREQLMAERARRGR